MRIQSDHPWTGYVDDPADNWWRNAGAGHAGYESISMREDYTATPRTTAVVLVEHANLYLFFEDIGGTESMNLQDYEKTIQHATSILSPVVVPYEEDI